jgi:hypothetical protein
MVHLTEKPIELALRAMHYSSREGENVLDLFGGSGSTSAAAEQAKRNAFLMELDPLYCDVIVKRWEELTGREATLEGDGRTFAEIARERGTDEPERRCRRGLSPMRSSRGRRERRRMNRKIPPEAFQFYVGLGPSRSYEAVAEEFGCSRRGVADCAKRERWQERLAEVEGAPTNARRRKRSSRSRR